MMIFRKIIPEAPPKLLTILRNIIKGQDLFMGYKKYGMARNIIIGEYLLTFDQKNKERWSETNANYKLVMQDFFIHFLPPKVLQHQKIYLCRGLYNTHDTKIRKFICRVDEIVENLDKVPPFGMNQGFLEEEII